jgi:hypothetical protein
MREEERVFFTYECNNNEIPLAMCCTVSRVIKQQEKTCKRVK